MSSKYLKPFDNPKQPATTSSAPPSSQINDQIGKQNAQQNNIINLNIIEFYNNLRT